ncbi:MAG TPA: hypothetical protein VJQ56_06555 [Blastocatellia bacterium]|nr:hypothetical protein [Blastocatellia bacterium]
MSETLPQPDLTIIFRGLSILWFNHPATPSLCQIGILEDKDHDFAITITRSDGEKIPAFIPSSAASKRRWSLELTNSVGGIIKHEDGFDRNRCSLRYMIDLESPLFHNRNLDLNDGELHPIIDITSGVFYARNITQPLNRKQAGPQWETFGSVSNEIGCDITLERGGGAIMRSSRGDVIFNLPTIEDVTYQVVIDNIPKPHPFGKVQDEHFLKLYQRLFPNVNADERFDFELKKPISGPPHTDPPHDKGPDNVSGPVGPAVPMAPNPYLCGPVNLGTRRDPLE